MTLEILTSDLLGGIRHGFFTRKGGASSGIFAGLNGGPGSSDQCEAVTLNRNRAAQALMVPTHRFLSPRQIHSADVVPVGREGWDDRPKADALVTATTGMALCILTADCAPVLFADPSARVIGAAHAGWKGALGGVLEATITAMEALGARIERMRAVIGPTISQRAYEVGPEFEARFVAENSSYGDFFAPTPTDRLHFDLADFVLHRLREAGVACEWTGHCTYSDPARFYSYRRATKAGEPDYGRLMSAIVL